MAITDFLELLRKAQPLPWQLKELFLKDILCCILNVLQQQLVSNFSLQQYVMIVRIQNILILSNTFPGLDLVISTPSL